MPDPDRMPPSCFLGWTMTSPPPSTAGGPTLSTSIYETHAGFVALTWSRTAFGLSVRADCRIPCASSSSSPFSASSLSSSSTSSSSFSSFSFRFRPWFLWKRRGTKRFDLKKDEDSRQLPHQPPRTIEFVWDLTGAVFPSTGGLEPTSGFFLAASVDDEVFLLIGERNNELYRKAKSKKPIWAPRPPVLLSRRDFIDMPASCTRKIYTTTVNIATGGMEMEREISIDFGGGASVDLAVGIDGKLVLEVKKLKWKFRGNEKLAIDGGKTRFHVSWDVYGWFFPPSPAAGSGGIRDDTELGRAVFVLKFEGDEGRRQTVEEDRHSGKRAGGLWCELGLFGDADEWRRRRKGGEKMRSSSSSSSSTSSGSATSSSVMAWASAEENELKESDGFSLLVYFSRR